MRKLILLFLLSATILLAQTGFVEDFGDLDGWNGGNDYSLSVDRGVMQIAANKRNTWNSFTYSFSTVDLSANPFVSISIRCDAPVNVGFSVWDTGGNYAYPVPMYKGVDVASQTIEYCFDFSNLDGEVDMANINMMNFVFNPGGAMSYRGNVWFQDMRVGSEAHVLPDMSAIPDQMHYINSDQVTVPFRGVESLLGDSVEIEVESSDTAIIPTPELTFTPGEDSGFLTYTPAVDATGQAMITLTATGSEPDAKVVPFMVYVENNKTPQIDAVADMYIEAGMPSQFTLTGIEDGNDHAEQNIMFSATSSDTSILADPGVVFNQGESKAVLQFQPKMPGVVTVTINLEDNGGTAAGGSNAVSTSFQVTVFDNVNGAPTLDPIKDVAIEEGAVPYTIVLTGIDDGDADAIQTLTITATSSNTDLIPTPDIQYTSPDSTGILTFTPMSLRTGNSTITVSVSDNGGDDVNNGDMVFQQSFNINVRVKPVRGFQDNFNDGQLGSEWPYDWGKGSGEDSHRCFEEDGYLKIEIDKTRSGNKWAGLWYSIPQELDISENPYISIRMKTDMPGTNMLIFLWDAYDKYNTGGTVTKTVTDEWTDYFFDFSGLNLSGSGDVVDFSRIKALLINFDPGGNDPLFTGTFYWDDFKVGEYANTAPPTPVIAIDPVPDIPVGKDAGLQEIYLTGVTAGEDHNNPIIIEASYTNANLIKSMTVDSVKNETAVLHFETSKGRTGFSIITLRLSSEGALPAEVKFKLQVVDMRQADASNVSINMATEFQTIDGFGAFMGSDAGRKNDQVLKLAKDMGMSMVRVGVIGTPFEEFNDNSDPNVIDLDAFSTDCLPLETIRWMRDFSSMDKLILSIWSPPAWMKRNKALSAESWATDNKLDPFYYEEYAEHLTALIKMIKNETGIDLYAISLQNEPQFNEPYASCVVNEYEMRDMIKVVGPRFEAEGITTKIFWAEVLPAQNRVRQYIEAVKNDPEAAKYGDIVAIHNYDADGINVGGAGADYWANIYEWAQKGDKPCPTWMTETSGHENSWNGAMSLAGNIYNALGFGNSSAWVWWSFNDSKNSANYGLVIDNEPTSRYWVSKQYYKFLQPGAIRVEHTSENEDVPALAFKNPIDGKVSIILINKSTTPQVVSVNGAHLPAEYVMTTTSNFRNFENMGTVSGTSPILLPANSITTLYGNYDVTQVDDETVEIPETFKLYQNYPNPFNPYTTINFQLPQSSTVSVKIYNVLGKEVRTLVDRPYQTGYHSLRWNGLDNNGQQVATGMYMYRIIAGENTDVKKMVLIR